MARYRYFGIGAFLLYLIYVIISIVELLIGIRIVLKLFGAHAASPFVAWIYTTTAPLLQPFIGIFPSPTIDRVFTIEFSAVFALIFYGVIAYIAESVIDSAPPVTTT